MVGRTARVTTRSTHYVAPARIKVGGEDWAARCTDPLPIGTKIRVVADDGIVMEVSRALIPSTDRPVRIAFLLLSCCWHDSKMFRRRR